MFRNELGWLISYIIDLQILKGISILLKAHYLEKTVIKQILHVISK
jgi:hypothetical protein